MYQKIFFDLLIIYLSMSFSWRSTKFHGKSALLLDKNSAIKLLNNVGKKYGINTDVGFKTPSSKYFKFLKTEDFEMLRSYPHLITSNYGVNPIWCLWLTIIDGFKMSLYLNFVTEQVIWSKHRFSHELYEKNIIFEGEIIGGIFRIWDLLKPSGDKNNESYNLYQRIDILRSIIDQHYVSDPLIENLPIQLKTYVSYQHLRSFTETVLKQDKYNRGFLFVPVYKSVKCYSVIFDENHQIENIANHLNKLEDDDLIPYKIQVKEPIHSLEPVQEFWIAPIPDFKDNYKIYEWDRNHMYDLGLIAIRSKERSLLLQNTFKENKGINKYGIKNLLKFKCEYLKNFRKWEPFELVS